jgi:hypothetical protein
MNLVEIRWEATGRPAMSSGKSVTPSLPMAAASCRTALIAGDTNSNHSRSLNDTT